MANQWQKGKIENLNFQSLDNFEYSMDRYLSFG